MDINIYPSGKLIFKGKEFKCAVGKRGVVRDKREGDGATPAGCFPIRRVFYRADKLSSPETVFEVKALSPEDAWSDDVNRPEYNTFVKLPYSGSHENLWREDDVYDVVAVLGYNDDPPISGKGSAIFIHRARPNCAPTAGCIALALHDLIEILRMAEKDTKFCIREK